MSENEDKRRANTRKPVLLECRIEGASGRAEMRISDLSSGGCFVDTSIPYRSGDPISLTVSLDGTDVAMTGRVAHVQPGYGFGVALDVDRLSESERERLNARLGN